MTDPNKQPEQLARDTIDAATGWPIGWTIERRTVAPPFSHRIDEIKVKRLP